LTIIKLNAIDSTNSYLRQLCDTIPVDDMTIVVADFQNKGRGLMGTAWNSEKGKNLTYSVFKRHVCFLVDRNFYVSIVTSLALIKTLKRFKIRDLSIKWPNDILAGNKKICGILIENVIKRNQLEISIIGIGLNVNQHNFVNLPNASSMKKLTGSVFNLDKVLRVFQKEIKTYFEILKHEEYELLKNEYERHLFQQKKKSQFKMPSGTVMTGIIEGVNEQGELIIHDHDGIKTSYGFKELELIY